MGRKNKETKNKEAEEAPPPQTAESQSASASLDIVNTRPGISPSAVATVAAAPHTVAAAWLAMFQRPPAAAPAAISQPPASRPTIGAMPTGSWNAPPRAPAAPAMPTGSWNAPRLPTAPSLPQNGFTMPTGSWNAAKLPQAEQAMPRGSWDASLMYDRRNPGPSSSQDKVPPSQTSTQSSSAKQRELEAGSYTGRIIRKLPSFGFIHCEQIMKESGTDVYISGQWLEAFSVGDWVDFEIEHVPGNPKPRAVCVRPTVMSNAEPPQKKQKVLDGALYTQLMNS